MTNDSPEFTMPSQTITRSFQEINGYQSSCQKLLVFKHLNLQIESCCWGRDRSEQLQSPENTGWFLMIQWIFSSSQFAKLLANRSSRWSEWTSDVKTKHDVLLPVFVEYPEFNQTPLKWFVLAEKSWYYKFSVLKKRKAEVSQIMLQCFSSPWKRPLLIGQFLVSPQQVKTKIDFFFSWRVVLNFEGEGTETVWVSGRKKYCRRDCEEIV